MGFSQQITQRDVYESDISPVRAILRNPVHYSKPLWLAERIVLRRGSAVPNIDCAYSFEQGDSSRITVVRRTSQTAGQTSQTLVTVYHIHVFQILSLFPSRKFEVWYISGSTFTRGLPTPEPSVVWDASRCTSHYAFRAVIAHTNTENQYYYTRCFNLEQF